MSAFTVTTATLKTKSDELNDLVTRYRASIERLVSYEASLNSMWDGEANDAFHNAFSTDKVKMDEFAALINQYIEKLIAIAARYEQTEQVNTDIATNRTY